MSRGIIQTAISNQLPLELFYREPYNSGGDRESFAFATEQMEHVAALNSDEFELLLRI
jgi:hypothetical protein